MRAFPLRSIVIACLALLAATAYAEECGGTILGRVLDAATGQPLQYVQAALRRQADSTVVTGQITDSLGRFELRGVAPGDYTLSCRMIGYAPYRSAALRIADEATRISLGAITLETASLEMDAVEVSAEKLLFTSTIDRKVYNVERDLISKAGTASDLLQNVPSVQVDLDGNVSLRGSTNVLIMVDGRASPLLNKNGASALEQMPAGSIERIEVITNPSAEYQPDAAAGIINIVKKKNTAPGLNGSLAANAGNRDRYNTTLSLSYNPGRANLYGSYSLRRNNRNRHSTDRALRRDSSVTVYEQTLDSHMRPLAHSLSAGGDWRPNRRQQLGLSASLFAVAFDRNEQAENRTYNAAGALNAADGRERAQVQTYREAEATAFYERSFAGEGHNLHAELTLSDSPESEDNRYINRYALPAVPDSRERSRLDEGERSVQAKLDYVRPLAAATLKIGYEAVLNGSDFDLRVDDFDTTRQRYVVNAAKTNRFQHDEAIHALYATWQRAFGKLGVLAGVRAEAATVRARLVTLDSTVTRDYVSVYPSLHLSYALSKPAKLQLSYSRRTRRPDAGDLNPFPEYFDPHSIRSGNPALRPKDIHSLELGCQYRAGKVSLTPALFYRYTDHRFTWVTRALNDSVLLTTHDNLSSDQSGGLELNISAAMKKLLSLHGNASVFQNQIDASNLSADKQTVTTWSSSLTFDVNPRETTRLQLSSTYRSAQLTATGSSSPTYQLNAGLRQELLRGKLIALATVTDLLQTMRRRWLVDTPALEETYVNRMDSRVFFAGLTYRFGTPPKKARDDQIRYDDAQ